MNIRTPPPPPTIIYAGYATGEDIGKLRLAYSAHFIFKFSRIGYEDLLHAWLVRLYDFYSRVVKDR